MEIDSVQFNAVISGVVDFSLFPSLRVFFFIESLSTQAGLGIVYTAEPVVDDIVSTFQLYVVTFESQYFTTTQGKNSSKK
jgi:hypothetical protein